MGGIVTWIGVGLTGLIAGYEAIIAQNPELGAIMGGSMVVVVGVARKIEKVMKLLQR